MKKQYDRPVLARMPEPLIKRLDAAARRAGRSRSEELRLRLEESLSRAKAVTATITTSVSAVP